MSLWFKAGSFAAALNQKVINNKYTEQMRKNYIFLLLLLTGIIAKAQFTKLLDFGGAVNGTYPYGSLISDGTFLYGMTSMGGTHSNGSIFKVKPDGTGYTDLLDFTAGIYPNYGETPLGSLIYDGTYLYGMTSVGGTSNDGVIFKIKTDGTSYTVLYTLAGVDGANPYGDLVSDGTYLYGMTSSGAANNKGNIFKIKTDGTGFTDLMDFAGTSNGEYPYGSLIYDGTYLYGTAGGGVNYGGTIFKIKPDGTGYTKLYDFVIDSTGYFPICSLVSDGTYLYGMTNAGGANNKGVAYKIKKDGTGYTSIYSLIDQDPTGPFIYDGTYLYSMARSGGTNSEGNVFKIKPDGSGYTDLYDFSSSGTDGQSPHGTVLSSGGDLYGLTYYGGANGYGVLFKLGSVAGVNELKNNTGIVVYPNPSNGRFTVEEKWQAVSGSHHLSVYNIVGEQVYSESYNSTSIQIDLTAFPKGVYFLQLQSLKDIQSCKIILQ